MNSDQDIKGGFLINALKGEMASIAAKVFIVIVIIVILYFMFMCPPGFNRVGTSCLSSCGDNKAIGPVCLPKKAKGGTTFHPGWVKGKSYKLKKKKCTDKGKKYCRNYVGKGGWTRVTCPKGYNPGPAPGALKRCIQKCPNGTKMNKLGTCNRISRKDCLNGKDHPACKYVGTVGTIRYMLETPLRVVGLV